MATTTTQPAPAETQPEKRDFRREVTDSIIRMLEQGVAPWQKPWDAGALQTPFNPNSGRPYRGGNAVHLMAVGLKRGFADPRWMTYRQAAENGWQVRKGEKGTQIEFWEFARSEPSQGAGETESKPGGAADPGAAKSDASRPLHRIYTVFNGEQIDGIPKYTRKVHTAFEVAQAGEQILRNSGATLAHDQNARAFYDRASDSIHLPPKEAFRDAAGYYGTALHELAHWTGHPARLNRATLTDSYRFGDVNYAKEELRAEIASIFIAAEKGIPHDPASHASYVGSWIKALSDDKHEIFRAAQDASKAADYVLALERDKSVAELVETAAPEPSSAADQSLPPHEQATRDIENAAVAGAALRREIEQLDNDHEVATGQSVSATKADAAEERRVPGSRGDVTGSQPATATDQRPNRDALADSFRAARALTTEALGDGARTVAASTESGTYRGKIIGETDHHVLQQLSMQTAVAHMKHLLDPHPAVGTQVVVAYSNSKAVVKEFHERAQSKELAR